MIRFCKNKANENEYDLHIEGEIVDNETREVYAKWYDIEDGVVCPKDVRKEMDGIAGKRVNVYIDSVGGDVWSASTIYSMLKEHDGEVIVKVTGIAASSASFVAMAGDKIYMARTATMMIHNPMTMAVGNRAEMEKAIEQLDVCKDTILNAYEAKANIGRDEISRMMDEETWMDYKKAEEYGFCDGLIGEESEENAGFFGVKMMYNVWNKSHAVDKVAEIAEGNSDDLSLEYEYLRLKKYE